MYKWIINVLSIDKIKNLEKKIEELQNSLIDKQNHIDKTNAYWKKKVYNLTKNKNQ